MLAVTNCINAHNTLACLRDAPFDVLNATFANLSFLPIVDGMLISEFNSIALANGNFVKVPLLIVTNTDEGKVLAGYGVKTTEEFRSYIENFGYTRTSNRETLDCLVEAHPFPVQTQPMGNQMIPSYLLPHMEPNFYARLDILAT